MNTIVVPSGDHSPSFESLLAWVPVASTEIRWIGPAASVVLVVTVVGVGLVLLLASRVNTA